TFLPKAVESGSERALQPLHSRHEVGFRSFHSQMVVVAHDDVGVQFPPAALHDFKQTTLEGFPASAFQKQLLAVVASTDHVVDRPRILNALLSRHAPDLNSKQLSRQCLNSTFDP